jgi:hypothetical protein
MFSTRKAVALTLSAALFAAFTASASPVQAQTADQAGSKETVEALKKRNELRRKRRLEGATSATAGTHGAAHQTSGTATAAGETSATKM